MPFSASAIFCFTSSISSKMFPFEEFFSSKETKNQSLGRDQVTFREGKAGDYGVLGQKLLNTQSSVDRCARKSPIRKGVNTLSLQKKKNPLKPNAASHNSASWYPDTDRFLEHSPSWGKPVLQGARPPEDNSSFLCVGVFPLIYNYSEDIKFQR